MSNVENYSTDLVCGKNRNDLREILLRNGAPFFSANIADRVSHTSAVDTTAHSIWRGKERRRMPTNPVSTSPVHTAPPPFFLPRARISRILRPYTDRTYIAPFAYPQSTIGRRTKTVRDRSAPFKASNPFSIGAPLSGRREARSRRTFERKLPIRLSRRRNFLFSNFCIASIYCIVLFSLGRVSYSDLKIEMTREEEGE